jgi:DNA-binding XRE family transcriptional regulator
VLKIEALSREKDRLDPYWRERGRYGIWPLPQMVLFGARIRRGRLNAGMSQRQLAAKAGVSQSGISRLERGLGIGMTAMRLVAIGMALGPDFPFGCCSHEHRCAWPYDPLAPGKPKPRRSWLS